MFFFFFSLKTAIQLADVNKGYPVEMDLTKLCPSMRDVQTAYEKLKELILIGRFLSELSLLFCRCKQQVCWFLMLSFTAVCQAYTHLCLVLKRYDCSITLPPILDHVYKLDIKIHPNWSKRTHCQCENVLFCVYFVNIWTWGHLQAIFYIMKGFGFFRSWTITYTSPFPKAILNLFS